MDFTQRRMAMLVTILRILRSVEFQKTAYVIYTEPEAWNHTDL